MENDKSLCIKSSGLIQISIQEIWMIAKQMPQSPHWAKGADITDF